MALFENLKRIESQGERVKECMLKGRWWTKSALAEAVGGSPHAMSARLSDLRQAGYEIEKKFMGDGLYLYRMVHRRGGLLVSKVDVAGVQYKETGATSANQVVANSPEAS